MVWKDCFGKELVKGEDIIVAINGEWNQPVMHSGIVIDMDDSKCYITYNSWDGDKEYVYNEKFYKFEYEDGIVKCVYKLNK